MRGKGPLLDLPTIPVANLPITVQLISTDGPCWQATYSAPAQNQNGTLKATAD